MNFFCWSLFNFNVISCHHFSRLDSLLLSQIGFSHFIPTPQLLSDGGVEKSVFSAFSWKIKLQKMSSKPFLSLLSRESTSWNCSAWEKFCVIIKFIIALFSPLLFYALLALRVFHIMFHFQECSNFLIIILKTIFILSLNSTWGFKWITPQNTLDLNFSFLHIFHLSRKKFFSESKSISRCYVHVNIKSKWKKEKISPLRQSLCLKSEWGEIL